MNTLEVYSIVLVEWLILSVFSARNLIRPVQRRTMVDWLVPLLSGFNAMVLTGLVLFLVSHPDQIHPASGVPSQMLVFSSGIFIYAFLMLLALNMGRRIHQPGT